MNVQCDHTCQRFNTQTNCCHLGIRLRGCLNQDCDLLMINHVALVYTIDVSYELMAPHVMITDETAYGLTKL